jgi:hypothetical protein
VRPKEAGIQPNAGNPLADQSGILSRRYRAIRASTAAEEKLARLFIGGDDVAVDRLLGLLRHLEPDGLAGLLLANGCPIDRWP